MTEEFRSLVVIAAIAAFVPLIVGLFRIKVAEVVLLLGAGIVFGPEVIGWIRSTTRSSCCPSSASACCSSLPAWSSSSAPSVVRAASWPPSAGACRSSWRRSRPSS